MTTDNRHYLEQLRTARAEIRAAELSPNTRRNYQCDWSHFERWCADAGVTALPATRETVELFATYKLSEGMKVTSAKRACSAIAHYHRRAGTPSPVDDHVRWLFYAAQRQRGEKPSQKRPLTVEQLHSISATLRVRGTARALRDRAVLVVGFASALRRSNIAALRLEDVEFEERGIVIHVGREKQDQLARGRLIAIPHGARLDTCAPTCVREWLAVRGSHEGRLFAMGGENVCRVVKRSVAMLGLPKAEYGGHSLRAGFVTAGGEAGLGELLIASQTGHRSMATVRTYFRRSEIWRQNPAGLIGL